MSASLSLGSGITTLNMRANYCIPPPGSLKPKTKPLQKRRKVRTLFPLILCKDKHKDNPYENCENYYFAYRRHAELRCCRSTITASCLAHKFSYRLNPYR